MDFAGVKQQLDMHGVPCREHAVIAPYTTFRIGGEVALLVEPQSEEQLVLALSLTRRLGMSRLVLGRGSNVLFADERMPLVVIRTAQIRKKTVTVEGETVYAGAGESLLDVTRAAQRSGLSGLEFAHGIPGTLGGAITMNAGAYGGEMRDVVTAARVYDGERDEVRTLGAAELDFSYRHSCFLSRPHLTVLGARLTLHADDPTAIEARMNDYMQRRRDKQPLEYPSAGSVFKRPVGAFAGALIEQSGLKGCRIGGAMVSSKHAGFIVNVGGATAKDVLSLIGHIQDTVERDHGVRLETEVQILTSLHARGI